MKTLSRIICLVFSFFLSLDTARAETVIAPNEDATNPALGSQGPFAGNGGRYQNVYNSSEFLAAMPNGGIIHEIALRLDESDRNEYFGTIPDLEVWMGTASSLAPVLTLELADNIGSDYKVVFPRGTLSYSISRSSDAVNPFQLRIPLADPFVYDPRNGGLTVEFYVRQRSTTGLLIDTSGQDGFAIQANINQPSGRLLGALVMELTFTPIPEPGTLAIIAAGLGLFLWKGWRP